MVKSNRSGGFFSWQGNEQAPRIGSTSLQSSATLIPTGPTFRQLHNTVAAEIVPYFISTERKQE